MLPLHGPNLLSSNGGVSTYDLYTTPVEPGTWDVPATGAAQEVWERMGFDVEECLEFTEHSPVQQAFRTLLFSRIVPCVKDIGLRPSPGL